MVYWCDTSLQGGSSYCLTKAGEESHPRVIPVVSHPLVVQRPAFTECWLGSLGHVSRERPKAACAHSTHILAPDAVLLTITCCPTSQLRLWGPREKASIPRGGGGSQASRVGCKRGHHYAGRSLRGRSRDGSGSRKGNLCGPHWPPLLLSHFLERSSGKQGF